MRGAPFRSEFAASRERLDYSWHVRYSLRRQDQQDAIIRKMLRESAEARVTQLRNETLTLTLTLTPLGCILPWP